PTVSTLSPYTTLFRSNGAGHDLGVQIEDEAAGAAHGLLALVRGHRGAAQRARAERAEADRVGSQQAERLVAHESSLNQWRRRPRSEEHTSELQSPYDL